MGTLEELLGDLPWGLHDAHLEALHVDYAKARLELTLRLGMGEETYRRATLRVEGLVYCAIDPPACPGEAALSVWISDGPGIAPSAASRIPPAPEGCFVHWLFAHEWNAFLHLCGKNATLTWLEAAPVPK